MSFEELVERTKTITKEFPVRNWTPETRTLDLVEEVGELCSAILEYHGHKTVEAGTKEAVVDSLCDILYDLILLFDYYHVDIESTYKKMLDELEVRIKNHEWGKAK